MPLAHLQTLGPKTTTPLAEAPPINLTRVQDVSLKLTCTYAAEAAGRVRIHVVPSDDGARWRPSEAQRLDADFQPAQTIRQSWRLNVKAKFVKVLVENTDVSEPVSALDVVAALGG
jgi:hypothetical protein